MTKIYKKLLLFLHFFIFNTTVLYADDVTVYEWRIWCNTEMQWVYMWSETEPTTCPNDTGHSINSASTSVIRQLATNLVTIRDEYVPTGRHYKGEMLKIIAAAGPGVTTIESKSWPFNISLLLFSIYTDSNNIGDFLTIELPSEYPTGTITQDVAISDTVIYVSQTVLDNVAIGYWITLDDGVNTESLGRILAVDNNNLTITMETPATNAYLASTPTVVKFTIAALKDYEMNHEGSTTFGRNIIGSTPIPKDLPAIIKYLNNSATPKTLFFEYEYLY